MNKKLFRAAAFLTAGVLWAGAAGVSCAADKMQTPVSPAKQGEKIEIQMEYLDGRYFKERDIDLYDLHLYRQYCKVHHISLHYGLTVERAVGATTEQGIRRDSQAVGLGPSYMIRWEKDWSSKWSGSIDGTGSILAYNHAHPAGRRAFGFLWRIGGLPIIAMNRIPSVWPICFTILLMALTRIIPDIMVSDSRLGLLIAFENGLPRIEKTAAQNGKTIPAAVFMCREDLLSPYTSGNQNLMEKVCSSGTSGIFSTSSFSTLI